MRVILLAVLVACRGAPPAPEPSAALQPAPTPPLAEALYGGELGAQAEPLGDRVRILLWLRELDLSPEALEDLRKASVRVRAAEARAQAARAAMGVEEQARVQPTYEALARQLATGLPTDPQASAEAITKARIGLPDPRKARADWVRGALDEAALWVSSLDERQREGMASALFFLRRKVSADLTPELYRDLLGDPWQAGDFASLRRSRSGQQDPLDVGGLFTLEGGGKDLLENLDGLKLEVLVAVALAHPDLAPSIEVIQGRRDPLDLGTPAAP